MVMMAFLLPVECGMFEIRQHVHGRSRSRQRHRLPEHGKQHDEEDGGSTHGSWSVAKHRLQRGRSGQSDKKSVNSSHRILCKSALHWAGDRRSSR